MCGGWGWRGGRSGGNIFRAKGRCRRGVTWCTGEDGHFLIAKRQLHKRQSKWRPNCARSVVTRRNLSCRGNDSSITPGWEPRHLARLRKRGRCPNQPLVSADGLRLKEEQTF